MSTPALSTAGQQRLEVIRERLAASTNSDAALRVMLVLAHELERYRALALPTARERSGIAPSVARTADPARDYASLIARIHELVTAVVPANTRVLVVSRGDDALLPPGVAAAHFPPGPTGGYAGYYPADSDGAVAELDRCRSNGAQYLVLPSTSFWWLDFYSGLAQALLARARVVHHDRDVLIFALNNEP